MKTNLEDEPKRLPDDESSAHVERMRHVVPGLGSYSSHRKKTEPAEQWLNDRGIADKWYQKRLANTARAFKR